MEVLSRLLSIPVAANALVFCLLIATLPDIMLRLYIFCVPISCHRISRFALVASVFTVLCNIIRLLSIYPCAGMDTKNITAVLAYFILLCTLTHHHTSISVFFY